MVVIISHETSSSTPYDVFLSFRGEDTRYTFTDHLYTALVQHGFRTFRDNDEMQKGEFLKSELEKAIPQSKSSIIVISENYASSTWCLDELVMILERRRTSGHVVVPVFYHVEPSEVRKQTGRTVDAFAKYEKQCEEETDSEGKRKWMENIKRWRSALAEVADLIGEHLKDHKVDGHESKFIQNIVQVIGDKLRHPTLDVAPCKVGLDSRAKDINMWLQDGSNDVSICAICGMGGIGKTTIAKFVYNQNSNSFDSSSFLANIREVSEQTNGLLCLQRQLLSDISKRKHGKIHNVDKGLAEIKDLVCSKRVLLVLDDVEQKDQIYAIFGMQDWHCPGSKVIITTRHEKLIKPHKIYKVEKLGQDESIKLFSFHAFGEDFPLKSYTEHTKKAVQICEGLPLALKVVGSSLSDKSEDEWVSELAKLEAIPHSQIHNKLKISYDSLQDDYEKRLFLDVAFLFVGTNKDYAIKILEKCYPHAKLGIQNIINHCLLTTYGDNVLGMHHLIQDMGREIIHQESHEAGERSRLWHHWDSFNVLKNNTGTKTIEGLTLDKLMLKEVGNDAKKLCYEEFSDKSTLSKHASSLKQRCLSFVSGQSVSTTLRSPNDIDLKTDAFKNMTKLRLLKLSHVQLTGSYENFPKGLVWLSWQGFPLKSIPVEFLLENLVALDLRHSRLEQVWKQTPFLGSLKSLDLSYSEWLARTPKFLGLPNLDRLILKGCVRLVEICESIGNLEMLDILDLEDCKTLRKLPVNMGKLGSLKTLVISGCNIREFPSEMRIMKSLEVIKADGNVINPLHSSSEEVKWWELIVWPMVATPRKGPETVWASLPCSLIELSLDYHDLSRCNLSDDSFPVNFSNLSSLNYSLDLSRNPFSRLLICIKNLYRLRTLSISYCYRLKSCKLNGLPMKPVWINATSFRPLGITMSVNGMFDLDPNKECFKNEGATKFYGRVAATNNRTRARRDNIQGKFEYGVFSVCLEGSAIPTFTGEKCEGSSSICFTVPSLLTHTIQCLNAWCKYEATDYFNRYLKWASSIKIKNKTKDLTWIHCSIYFSIYGYMGWLTRWRFGNELEAGDEIIITFDCSSNDYVVKECGYKIVSYYDPEEEEDDREEEEDDDREEEENVSTSTIEESHHPFPAPRLNTGTFFTYDTSKVAFDKLKTEIEK